MLISGWNASLGVGLRAVEGELWWLMTVGGE